MDAPEPRREEADRAPVFRPRFTVRRMMGIVLAFSLVFALMASAMQAQSTARCSQCVNNLKQIALALHNYHSSYDCFPPAYTMDAQGKPLVSWRVLILPFMEQWPREEPGEPPPPPPPWSHMDEPWDSANNRKLAAAMPSYYACPNHSDRLDKKLTSYVLLTGRGTPFVGGETTSFSQLHGPSSDAVVVVEVANVDIPWMAPRDLDIDQMSAVLNDPSRPGISSMDASGPHLAMADGSVKVLNQPLSLDALGRGIRAESR
jgi:hypothetical protein